MPAHTDSPVLSEKFNDAVEDALFLHRTQVRKGTNVPYIAHVLSVAALVLEMGGDEDIACAAVLHDVLEDTDITDKELEGSYGERVVALVAACSENKSLPWLERKQAFVRSIPTLSPGAFLIEVADKLHNARSIYNDLQCNGWDATMAKFKAAPIDTYAYYWNCVEELHEREHSVWTDELIWLVDVGIGTYLPEELQSEDLTWSGILA